MASAQKNEEEKEEEINVYDERGLGAANSDEKMAPKGEEYFSMEKILGQLIDCQSDSSEEGKSEILITPFLESFLEFSKVRFSYPYKINSSMITTVKLLTYL